MFVEALSALVADICQLGLLVFYWLVTVFHIVASDVCPDVGVCVQIDFAEDRCTPYEI